MPSNFPGAIDSFTDPLSNSPLNSPSHSALHSDINDAVEKVETYMGLVKVIPTGATNGTVGATGTVTIGNAVSSVTVSGAFSSLYDNYRILVSGHRASVDNTLCFRFGTATTEHYGSQFYDLYTGAGTGYNRSNNAGFIYVSPMSTTAGRSLVAIDVFSPFLSTQSTIAGSNYGNGYSGWFGGEHFSTTSFTSFVLLPFTGTITGGTIRVYGYRN